MNSVSSHQAVDPWYDLYTTGIADPNFLETLIAPSIERFKTSGYGSAIVTEKKQGDYHLHVFAIQNTHQNTPDAVSSKAPKIADHHQISQVPESDHEPIQVSFF